MCTSHTRCTCVTLSVRYTGRPQARMHLLHELVILCLFTRSATTVLYIHAEFPHMLHFHIVHYVLSLRFRHVGYMHPLHASVVPVRLPDQFTTDVWHAIFTHILHVCVYVECPSQACRLYPSGACVRYPYPLAWSVTITIVVWRGEFARSLHVNILSVRHTRVGYTDQVCASAILVRLPNQLQASSWYYAEPAHTCVRNVYCVRYTGVGYTHPVHAYVLLVC